MVIMNSSQQFTNARVHEWLTPELDNAVRAMRTTRVQLNSAALWWFCTQLSAKERAEILGEYVKHQALAASGSQELAEDDDLEDSRARRRKVD